MWRILYPIQYFRLSNADKRRIDLIPTLLLAAIIAVPFIFLPGVSFFHANGFLDKALTLTAALTGFYVAALVAAATFFNPDMDKPIRSGPVELITKDADGSINREALTRREFACMIFGYLAASTLMFSIAVAVALGFSTFDWWNTLGKYFFVGRAIVIFCYSVWISHITTVTALGLFYLMDRLHREDPKIVSRKSDLNKVA